MEKYVGPLGRVVGGQKGGVAAAAATGVDREHTDVSSQQVMDKRVKDRAELVCGAVVKKHGVGTLGGVIVPADLQPIERAVAYGLCRMKTFSTQRPDWFLPPDRKST